MNVLMATTLTAGLVLGQAGSQNVELDGGKLSLIAEREPGEVNELLESFFLGDGPERIDPLGAGWGYPAETPLLSHLYSAGGDAPIDVGQDLSSDAAPATDWFTRSEGALPADDPDHFGVVWHGFFAVGGNSPLQPGNFTFGTASNDGSSLTVDGQLVVDNNRYQPWGEATATVQLDEGYHEILIGYYEGDGDSHMEAAFAPGARVPYNDLITINPVDPAQAGIWSAASVQPLQLGHLNATVTASSELNAVAGGAGSMFGHLTMHDGTVLTTAGRGDMHFSGTTILPDNTGTADPDELLQTVGFHTRVDTYPGPIEGPGPMETTVVKTGPAALVLSDAGTGLEGTTFDVQRGRIVVIPGGLLARLMANFRLSGGELVLGSAGEAAADNVTLDNPVTVVANSRLTAGGGDGIVRPDPLTVTLGGPGRGVLLDGGILTLDSEDGFRLDVAGKVTGRGGMRIDESADIVLSGGGNVGSLNASEGRLRLETANLRTERAAVVPGVLDTGGSQLIVSERLKLGETSYRIDTGSVLSLTDVEASDPMLTLAGGTVTVGRSRGGDIGGSTDAADFTVNGNTGAHNAGVPAFGAANTLQITNMESDEAASVFFNSPQDISEFRIEFDYQVADPGENPADGIALVLQNAGRYALGTRHRGLGYAGIEKSVAVLLNLFEPQTRGVAFGVGGSVPAQDRDYLSTGAVDLASGHLIHTTLDYDGFVLSLDLEDVVTGETFSTSYDVDIVREVGGDTALIGITGSTGGYSANQIVSGLTNAEDLGAGLIDQRGTDLTVVADTMLRLANDEGAEFGDLMLRGGTGLLMPDLDQRRVSFGDVRSGRVAVLDGGNVQIRGRLSPGETTGILSVVGNLELGDDAEYFCELAGPENDLVVVTGEVVLGGSLSFEAISRLGVAGRHARQVILGGSISSFFASEPAVDSYIGHGAFYRGVTFPAMVDGLVTMLDEGSHGPIYEFDQYEPGDVDGDWDIDNADMLLILSANSYDHPATPPAPDPPWTWLEGDFNDDSLVTSDDIQLVLETGLFGAGSYAATAAGEAVDEGGDGSATLTVDPASGCVTIDTGADVINGYIMRSADDVFTGDVADNVGMFQTDRDDEISGAVIRPGLAGSLNLGEVIGLADLAAMNTDAMGLLEDLTFTYTIEGRKGIFEGRVSVAPVPEPGTLVLLAIGALVLLGGRRRRAPCR